MTAPLNQFTLRRPPAHRGSQVRLSYSSLVAPASTLDYDPRTRTLGLVKQKEVPNYDPSEYGTARLFVAATDGAQVPPSHHLTLKMA